MGATKQRGTVESLIAEQIQPFEYEGCMYAIIDHELVGNELWRVIEAQVPDEHGNLVPKIPEDRELVVTVIEPCEPGFIAYHMFAEACHPYYYKCPERFLAMVPPANQQWRNIAQDVPRPLPTL